MTVPKLVLEHNIADTEAIILTLLSTAEDYQTEWV